MNKNKILNSSGFTLVEIMVSVGLLAIVSMSLINLYDFFGKTVRKSNADYLIEEIETKITYLVTDKMACDNTLADRIVPINYVAPSAATATNISIRDYNNDIALSENDLFSHAKNEFDNSFLPKTDSESAALVRVNKIYVHNFNMINTQEFETSNWQNFDTKIQGYRKGYIRLTIEFDLKDIKENGEPLGWGRKVLKDILLGVVLERGGVSNRIIECADYKDTAMATSIKNVCDDLDGTITYNNGQMFCAGTQQSLLRELRLTACRYLPFHAFADHRGWGHAIDCTPNTNGPNDPDFYSCNGDKITGISHYDVVMPGGSQIRHHIFTCKNWMSPP